LAKQRERGYSLTEILLVLAIMALALTVTLPAMSSFMRSYSARVAADEFVSHMRLARHLSIARHQPVSFTATTTGYSLPDWNSPDIATAPLRNFAFPGTCSLVSGAGTVTFRPDGTVSSGATSLRIEIAMGNSLTARYDVAVAATGKVSATYTKVSS
jgi:type IV fimbrial biogenesis protein FimT